MARGTDKEMDMARRDLRRKGIENQTEGTLDEFEGKVRGDIGDALDNESEHVKGRVKETRGKVQRKIGEAQERLGSRDDKSDR